MRCILFAALVGLAGCAQKPVKDAAPAKPTKPAATPASETRIKWGSTVVLGAVKVKVTSAVVGTHGGYDQSGQWVNTGPDHILFRLEVVNADATRNVEVGPADKGAELRDEHGGASAPTVFGGNFGTAVRFKDGQVPADGITLYADKPPTQDMIFFPRPAPAAKKLTLILDGRNYGMPTRILIDVPEAAWKK